MCSSASRFAGMNPHVTTSIQMKAELADGS